MVLAELVAFDHIPAFQLFTGLGILRDHADPVACIWVDQVEPDPRPVMAGVVKSLIISGVTERDRKHR